MTLYQNVFKKKSVNLSRVIKMIWPKPFRPVHLTSDFGLEA